MSEDPLRFGVGPKLHVRNAINGPELRRLITQDAFRGRASNFYSYVTNSPTNRADPTGLWQATVASGGDGIGLLITFGSNNGHGNFGVYIGGAAGGFLSVDPGNKGCDCGFNAHAEGDIGIVESISGSVNVNQNGESSSNITVADPVVSGQTWTVDPLDPTSPPEPVVGIGAGAFSGFGYTGCLSLLSCANSLSHCSGRDTIR